MGVKIFNIGQRKLDKKFDFDEKSSKEYVEISLLDKAGVLGKFNTNELGLSDKEAEKRLDEHGKNIVIDKASKPWYIFLLKSFVDQFIIVLIILGTASFFLQDQLGAYIIYILAIISAIIRFVQEYSSYIIDKKLKDMIHTKTDVRRGSSEDLEELNIEEIAVGDVIELGAGSIIPADLRLFESKDIFVAQSIYTGETIPVEKFSYPNDKGQTGINIDNICLMGATVVSGSGVGVVIKTGKETYLGNMASTIVDAREVTNFEVGIKKITSLLIKYMIFIVLAVFFINGVIKKDWIEALFFAISIAVGITPSMLPMIVNVNLSKGAQMLAKKKTIVKNINSIQNLGAIDTLCTDKTGTLTIDKVVLQRYMDVEGNEDLRVIEYAFLNSYYSTGIKNIIDRAIVEYGIEHGIKEKVNGYKKLDEIPFDYNRKKMSVVVETPKGRHRLLTKGALEEILKICTKAKLDSGIVDLTDDIITKINSNADIYHNKGMHIIALAEKLEYQWEKSFSVSEENEMVFMGYVAFLDPPKEDAKESIDALKKYGINIKVLTGDSAVVTKNICGQVGIEVTNIVTGKDLETMDEEKLKQVVETTNIFARLSPLQKERVVNTLRKNGHVVGYMGDGVNDGPSLRAADVGISVDSATDIAKESSDIILLEKSLSVLKDGVIGGRRIYGNIMKYMKMTLSSNFGNVFSVLIGSIFLPFLPMIPIQILIQNLIYDLSQIAIPFDTVDDEFVEKPKKWDTKDLSHFMNALGMASSVFDIATYLALWFILGYNSIAKEAYFQTGWFMEGLISQTMIVHFIRTSKVPFIESIAHKWLLLSTGASITAAVVVPFLMQGIENFNFVALPLSYFAYLIAILYLYVLLVQWVKKRYIRKYGNWL